MTLTSRMLLELSADFSSALDLASLRVPLDVKTQVDDQIIHEVLASAPGIGEVDVDWRTGRLRRSTARS